MAGGSTDTQTADGLTQTAAIRPVMNADAETGFGCVDMHGKHLSDLIVGACSCSGDGACGKTDFNGLSRPRQPC